MSSDIPSSSRVTAIVFPPGARITLAGFADPVSEESQAEETPVTERMMPRLRPRRGFVLELRSGALWLMMTDPVGDPAAGCAGNCSLTIACESTASVNLSWHEGEQPDSGPHYLQAPCTITVGALAATLWNQSQTEDALVLMTEL